MTPTEALQNLHTMASRAQGNGQEHMIVIQSAQTLLAFVQEHYVEPESDESALNDIKKADKAAADELSDRRKAMSQNSKPAPTKRTARRAPTKKST